MRFAHVLSARGVEFGSGGINTYLIDNFTDALNEFTGLKADYEGYITIDDVRLLEIPIVISVGGATNESENEMMARYLLPGGFVVGHINFEGLAKYGGLVEGRDFWRERLPDDHLIYSAFFDIGGGAPSSMTQSGSGKQSIDSWNQAFGYYVKGRLAGITFGWWAHHPRSPRGQQLVSNIVVYALTQEGSMTQRLMQMVD